jgi:hypothetical protein
MSLDSISLVSGETSNDVPDVEYQHQAGKAWLARIYQPKGTNHQDSLSPKSDVRAWRRFSVVGPSKESSMELINSLTKCSEEQTTIQIHTCPLCLALSRLISAKDF